ncbi:MAG TPA: pteridine reductase [Gammaproteobacteria bacterium]|nr:pteridine reductase [Gammaproteobacteria bacterium]
MHMSPPDLHGKVALVTGSALRIGATVNRYLHAAGCNILVHYHRSDTDAEALVDELNQRRPASAHSIRADLCADDQVEALIPQALTHWGRLDILVNNASSYYPTPVGETQAPDWDDLVGTNLKAPYFLAQSAAPALREQGGAIVNLADVHGQNPLPDHPVYCAAKAGLLMLTRALALDLAPDVRVNAIAPGSILWPEGAASIDTAQKDAILADIPLARQGHPDDIAQTLLYLVSDQSQYVTGQIIAVDGGRSLRPLKR